MRIRSQIAFVTIVMILVSVIVAIGIYTNGTKRLRKLDKTVQATWGDVGWRLEERDQFLPTLIEMAKPYLADKPEVYERVLEEKDRLGELVRTDQVTDVISSANQLDENIEDFFSAASDTPELNGNDKFQLAKRHLREIEDRITSFRNQYNEAVIKFNRFLTGIPGRFLGASYTSKILFDKSAKVSLPPAEAR